MVDSTSVNNPSAVDGMRFTHNIFSNNRPDLDDGAKEIAQSQTTLINQPHFKTLPIGTGDLDPRLPLWCPPMPIFRFPHSSVRLARTIGLLDGFVARIKRVAAPPKAKT